MYLMPESWFECTGMFWSFGTYGVGACQNGLLYLCSLFLFSFSQTLMTMTWRWRPNDHGQLTNRGSSRPRQVSQHGSWLLTTRETSTWIIDGHFLPGQLLRLTADLGASENARNWWRCKKQGWMIHQTPHLIFQFGLRTVYLKNLPDTHITWHVECVTNISERHMLNWARVGGRGSPLHEGNPRLHLASPPKVFHSCGHVWWA